MKYKKVFNFIFISIVLMNLGFSQKSSKFKFGSEVSLSSGFLIDKTNYASPFSRSSRVDSWSNIACTIGPNVFYKFKDRFVFKFGIRYSFQRNIYLRSYPNSVRCGVSGIVSTIEFSNRSENILYHSLIGHPVELQYNFKKKDSAQFFFIGIDHIYQLSLRGRRVVHECGETKEYRGKITRSVDNSIFTIALGYGRHIPKYKGGHISFESFINVSLNDFYQAGYSGFGTRRVGKLITCGIVVGIFK